MSPADAQGLILTVSLSIIGGLFGVLLLLLAFLGNKIYAKMDEIANDVKSMASELHGRITNLDMRITRIEAVEELCPMNQKHRSSDKGET